MDHEKKTKNSQDNGYGVRCHQIVIKDCESFVGLFYKKNNSEMSCTQNENVILCYCFNRTGMDCTPSLYVYSLKNDSIFNLFFLNTWRLGPWFTEWNTMMIALYIWLKLLTNVI